MGGGERGGWASARLALVRGPHASHCSSVKRARNALRLSSPSGGRSAKMRLSAGGSLPPAPPGARRGRAGLAAWATLGPRRSPGGGLCAADFFFVAGAAGRPLMLGWALFFGVGGLGGAA